ncbi:MAG: leucine-rich repeat protein [Clostridia bacterium]|nr:leucine-rich repeat protein [Clostridia bacterium]
MKQLKNERGVFTVDDGGTLCHFEYLPRPGWATDGVRNDRGGLNITDLVIPEGVYALPEKAFRGYRIHTAVLPESLAWIGKEAFAHCQIQNLTLKEHLRMDSTAFAASQISNLTLWGEPDPLMLLQLGRALRLAFTWFMDDMIASLPELCRKAFHGELEPKEQWQCISNESGDFFVDADRVLMAYEPPAGLSDGCLPDLLIPGGIKAIGSGLFRKINVSGRLYLPDSLRMISAGGDEGCFVGCTLKDVVLPAQLESLGLFAFGTCRISTLTIPARPDHALCLYGGRQFKDGWVNEIRLPAFCEPALREFWKDQRDIIIVPRSDPEFGEMVCALSPMGIRSDDVLMLMQMTCQKGGR